MTTHKWYYYCRTFHPINSFSELIMWVYITAIVFCVCVWKLIVLLRKYRKICNCLSHFLLPVDNHWFFGIAHTVKGSKTYLQALEKTVDKLQPKAVAKWLTWFYSALDVVHPDTVWAVLKASHTSVPKTHEYHFFLPWLGDGLFVTEGKKWECNRRLLTLAIYIDVLKPYVKIYNNVAEVFIEEIKLMTPDAQSIDIAPLASRATLDTLLRCVFSYEDEEIQSTDKCQHPFCENTGKVKYITVRRWANPLIHNDFIFGLTKDYREMKKCCNYLHDLFKLDKTTTKVFGSWFYSGGEGASGFLGYSSGSLQFITRFLKESMRMFSPAPAVARRLAKSLTIGGVTFPPHTIINVNTASLHHNPAVWENTVSLIQIASYRRSLQRMTHSHSYRFPPVKEIVLDTILRWMRWKSWYRKWWEHLRSVWMKTDQPFLTEILWQHLKPEFTFISKNSEETWDMLRVYYCVLIFRKCL